MIKLGTRTVQRIRVIVSEGEENKVLKWCERTGYVLTDSKPVHNILLAHADKIRARRLSKRSKPVPNPWGIVKGMAVFTAERPLIRAHRFSSSGIGCFVYIPPTIRS
jgi:hypothetical protein